MDITTNIVAEMVYDCYKCQTITDAIELLEDGFPLDDITIKALGEIGIDYAQFTTRFEIKE